MLAKIKIESGVGAIEKALSTLADVVRTQDAGDLAYFEGQKDRYRHTLERVAELFPAKCRILDVGSHYLHQASLLSLLGYEVFGIDLPLFAEAPFVKERASMFKVENSAIRSLESGTFLESMDGTFDVVLFTEIIEHITFNPIAYWSRIHTLLTDTGAIYLTTPNSLRPKALFAAGARLLSLRGVGLSVADILGNVTYGHHWKEYSAAELKQYFKLLSPDFSVRINMYSLLPQAGSKRMILRAIGVIPMLRSDIEAVVSVTGKTGFRARAPQLAMSASDC